jgi:hypothetical protein
LISRSLVTSYARGVTPRVQRCRERALIEAARLGETHLHLSTFAGEVLGLGAYHRTPGEGDVRPPTVVAAAATSRRAPGAAQLWRRHTGGRAVACGEGFVIVTLALPHRAALVGESAQDLKPEQVMNRCVRGFLASCRHLGLDPTYPGLDLVAVRRRAFAHLSFDEADDGTTLFQIVLAVTASFAATPPLLDHLDPHGVVPAAWIGADSVTTLGDELAEASVRDAVSALADPGDLVALVAAGYADSFPLELLELDPAVTEAMLEDEVEAVDAQGSSFPGPEPAASTATANGLLGPVSASVCVDRGQISRAGLSGDFIAPAWVVRRLCDRLAGTVLDREAIDRHVQDVLDGSRAYLLGMRSSALAELFATAAGL